MRFMPDKYHMLFGCDNGVPNRRHHSSDRGFDDLYTPAQARRFPPRGPIRPQEKSISAS